MAGTYITANATVTIDMTAFQMNSTAVLTIPCVRAKGEPVARLHIEIDTLTIEVFDSMEITDVVIDAAVYKKSTGYSLTGSITASTSFIQDAASALNDKAGGGFEAIANSIGVDASGFLTNATELALLNDLRANAAKNMNEDDQNELENLAQRFPTDTAGLKKIALDSIRLEDLRAAAAKQLNASMRSELEKLSARFHEGIDGLENKARDFIRLKELRENASKLLSQTLREEMKDLSARFPEDAAGIDKRARDFILLEKLRMKAAATLNTTMRDKLKVLENEARDFTRLEVLRAAAMGKMNATARGELGKLACRIREEFAGLEKTASKGASPLGTPIPADFARLADLDFTRLKVLRDEASKHLSETLRAELETLSKDFPEENIEQLKKVLDFRIELTDLRSYAVGNLTDTSVKDQLLGLEKEALDFKRLEDLRDRATNTLSDALKGEFDKLMERFSMNDVGLEKTASDHTRLEELRAKAADHLPDQLKARLDQLEELPRDFMRIQNLRAEAMAKLNTTARDTLQELTKRFSEDAVATAGLEKNARDFIRMKDLQDLKINTTLSAAENDKKSIEEELHVLEGRFSNVDVASLQKDAKDYVRLQDLRTAAGNMLTEATKKDFDKLTARFPVNMIGL